MLTGGPVKVAGLVVIVIACQQMRVADGWVMPRVVSGDPDAASMLIGYRCADFALAD